MEEERRDNGSSSSSLDLPTQGSLSSNSNSPKRHASHFDTVIPNRIFVGGIDYKVNESELRRFFSQYGPVKQVNIVLDHSGMSKGYGFVTFETEEYALKILHEMDEICFKNKRLNIGQAVRKRQSSQHSKTFGVATCDQAVPQPLPCWTVHLTTSSGYPYTFCNGVAYFHSPNMNPQAHHWPHLPQQSHQPVHQQPAYHQYQCVPSQYQWNVAQPQMLSTPDMYSQSTEHLFPPAYGGYIQDATPEFVEPTVAQVYPVYPQSAEGMAPFLPQYDPAQNQMFPHSPIHLKPKRRRYSRHKEWREFPVAADTSMLYVSQHLM